MTACYTQFSYLIFLKTSDENKRREAVKIEKEIFSRFIIRQLSYRTSLSPISRWLGVKIMPGFRLRIFHVSQLKYLKKIMLRAMIAILIL